MRYAISLFILLALVSACARNPVMDISNVDVHIKPENAVADPVATRGHKIRWGGIIISSTNLKDTTQLEILSYPLDRAGAPNQNAKASARFIALKNGYLESVDYAAGRAVTVIGTLEETRVGAVGEAKYTYPVVAIEQLHLWPKDNNNHDSPIHFGFGLGIIR